MTRALTETVELPACAKTGPWSVANIFSARWKGGTQKLLSIG
jgi:hypothetical protein